MRQSMSLFVDSLKILYLHIKPYELDYTWTVGPRQLHHSVLWYVTAGQFALHVQDARHVGRAGQIYLLPPRSAIRCHAITERVSLVSVNFDANITFLGERVWSEALHLPVELDGECPQIASVLQEMLRTAGQPSAAQTLLLQAGLQKLVALLLNRHIRSMPSGAVPVMDARVEKVIEYLSCRPDRFPKMAELCEWAEVSESHLRKLFIRFTGMPPLHFLHHMKTEQAKEMLVRSDARISDIAYRLGFADPNYFSRLFKNKTGFTPLQYRQKYGIWMDG